MKIILLERVDNLGHIGDEVTVRPGFARNFLFPQHKALRANEANRKIFVAQKAQIEARNAAARAAASEAGAGLEGKVFVLIRSAGDSGQLYGSVSARDICDSAEAAGFTLGRNQVVLDRPIKTIGMHALRVRLHPEVVVGVSVNVARSVDEATRQARGEDVFASAMAEDRALADETANALYEANLEAEADRLPADDA